MDEIVKTTFQSWQVWNDISYFYRILEILENYQDLFESPLRYGPSENRTFELSETTTKQKEGWYKRTGGGTFKIKKTLEV